jgi:hypothetical protein
VSKNLQLLQFWMISFQESPINLRTSKGNVWKIQHNNAHRNSGSIENCWHLYFCEFIVAKISTKYTKTHVSLIISISFKPNMLVKLHILSLTLVLHWSWGMYSREAKSIIIFQQMCNHWHSDSYINMWHVDNQSRP